MKIIYWSSTSLQFECLTILIKRKGWPLATFPKGINTTRQMVDDRPNENNSDRSDRHKFHVVVRPKRQHGGLCDFRNRRCRGNWRMRTKSCAKSWATKRWELLRLNGSQQMRFWKSNGNCMVPLTLVWFLSFKPRISGFLGTLPFSKTNRSC